MISLGMVNAADTKIALGQRPIRDQQKPCFLKVRIHGNFAFVQFETQEDATKALECTHMSKILDGVLSVEYALRDDGEGGDRYDSPRRDYGGRRDSHYRRRSPSPTYSRGRASPDYGRARSPVYDKYNGAYKRQMSPEYDRYRGSPVQRSRT